VERKGGVRGAAAGGVREQAAGQAGVPEDWPPPFSSSLSLTQLCETCSNGAAFKTLLKGSPQ